MTQTKRRIDDLGSESEELSEAVMTARIEEFLSQC